MRDNVLFFIQKLMLPLRGSGIGRNQWVRNTYKKFLKLFTSDYVIINHQKIYLDTNDSLGLTITRQYGNMQLAAAKKNIKQGHTVFDIGAYIGDMTLPYSTYVGKNGTVYAFEPSKENYHLLKKNIHVNGIKNIVAEMLGVSNITGKSYLHLYDDSQTHMVTGQRDRKSVPIQTISLDVYCELKKIRTVDFIKIDVEGGEYMVLKGMKKILHLNPQLVMIIEFCPKQLEKFDTRSETLLSFLQKYGYTFYDISDINKTITHTSKKQLLQKYDKTTKITNILCIRKG